MENNKYPPTRQIFITYQIEDGKVSIVNYGINFVKDVFIEEQKEKLEQILQVIEDNIQKYSS